jgi:hypothetical protein
MTTEETLLVVVCCVSLICLQILKYYMVRCHTLERKVRVLSYDSDPPDSILANAKISPIPTARGNPISSTYFPGLSSIFGRSVASIVPTIRASASKTITIITTLPRLATVLKGYRDKSMTVNQQREEPVFGGKVMNSLGMNSCLLDRIPIVIVRHVHLQSIIKGQ